MQELIQKTSLPTFVYFESFAAAICHCCLEGKHMFDILSDIRFVHFFWEAIITHPFKTRKQNPENCLILKSATQSCGKD